jgi:hypothetical protein
VRSAAEGGETSQLIAAGGRTLGAEVTGAGSRDRRTLSRMKRRLLTAVRPASIWSSVLTFCCDGVSSPVALTGAARRLTTRLAEQPATLGQKEPTLSILLPGFLAATIFSMVQPDCRSPLREVVTEVILYCYIPTA